MTMTTAGATDDTGVVTTVGVDDTGTTGDPTTNTTGEPPECDADAECESMAGECEVASCNSSGECEVANAGEGTACGDTNDTQCDGADTCDGNGTCVQNVAFNGMDCTECDGVQCICTDGACDDCVAFADTNLFTTDRSLVGWELTGDWGLYTGAPRGQAFADQPDPVPFGNQVLGTDGNRRRPYPAGHAERSYARTPPTELPSSITFQSWHLDEGAGQYDNKIIRISTDGGDSWTDIISCPLNPDLPFCQEVRTREADDWDSISLDLPAPLIGQVGIIEFAYDTGDSCCEFEKGWFIDVTNFATECACASDQECAAYGSDCGEGVCGGNSGCNLDAVDQGTACGDDTDDTCTNPDTCDGDGYCLPRNGQTNNTACTECEAGQDCNGCESGVCSDCQDAPESMTFDSGLGGNPLQSWTTTTPNGGGWGLFFSFVGNENGDAALTPMDAPMLGIDGNRFGAADGIGEISTSQIVSRADVVPAAITFQSWHQDQGGATLDLKRIDISVDGGDNWIPLADCSGGAMLSDFPFCTSVATREAEDWDDISLDTSMWEDMLGQLRFSYDTVTACCGFERGWYIDELNFAQHCLAPNLTNVVGCEFLPEDLCDSDAFCGWNSGASACVACSTFGEQGPCDFLEYCAWDVDFGACYGAPA